MFSHKPATNTTSHGVPSKASTASEKTTLVTQMTTRLWLVVSLVGMCFPELALKSFGIEHGDDATDQQKQVVKCLTKVGFLQISFLAALQGAVLGNTSTLQAKTVMGTMRAMMFANACWCGIACLWTWLIVVPTMTEQGWSTRLPLALSTGLVALGAMSYRASKGEEKTMLGGLLKFSVNANTEDLEVPPFSKQNMVFLFWMGICGVAVVSMVLVPGLFLQVHVGDVLTGAALEWCKLGVQLQGLFYGLQGFTLNLLVSSHLHSILYNAVRGLWAAGLAMLVAVCCLQDELEILNAPSKILYADIAVFGALVIMAYGCMKAHFSSYVRGKK